MQNCCLKERVSSAHFLRVYSVVACGMCFICRSMCPCFICLWMFVYISSHWSKVCMPTEADLRGAGMCLGGRGWGIWAWGSCLFWPVCWGWPPWVSLLCSRSLYHIKGAWKEALHWHLGPGWNNRQCFDWLPPSILTALPPSRRMLSQKSLRGEMHRQDSYSANKLFC